MACASTPLRIINIAFNGKNFDPITRTAMVKLGGTLLDGGEVTESGRYFPSVKKEPAEVEFEIALTADFDAEFFRGACGDMMVLVEDGVQYLIKNAMLSSSIEIKSGEGKIKLSFRGDEAVTYS